MKICWHDAGHMTMMAATPIYGKNPSKYSSPELAGRFPGNLVYVASGTPANHSLFKWWPWNALYLFYDKVKVGKLGFSTGKKVKTVDFQKLLQQVPLKLVDADI